MKNFIQLFIYTCLFIPLPLQAQFAGGDGSITNPFQVSRPEELSEVRNYPDSYFIQTNNIDLKNYDHNMDGKGWLPIAGGGSGEQFHGHYDGQNYIISNLTINRPGTPNVGLFGHIGVSDDVTDISIKNLGLVWVDIIGGRGVGALVGRVTSNANTKIEQCFVRYGDVTGDGATGGLVGSNNSYRSTANSDGYKPQISKSFANVDVYWSERISGDKFGGLAGCSQKGIIINSYARGSVNVDNTEAQLSSIERVGGLVGCGLQRAEIYYSYSTSSINVPESTPSVTNVGGLMGTSDGNTNIVSSYWDIETSGTSVSFGGTAETSLKMNSQSTFIDYDFTNIWGIDPAINDGYPYLLADGGGILPVELISFEAKLNENFVQLVWNTASEQNNDYFSIERSTNGLDFQVIENISGNGNSKKIIEYSTTDLLQESGQYYYRLKQTDFDGSFDYFPLIEIYYENKSSDFFIYPNPATDLLNINTKDISRTHYSIVNSNGKTLQTGLLTQNLSILNISNLPSDIYTIILYSDLKKSKSKRFIKQ